MKVFLRILAFCLAVGFGTASAAEVGYVNILNGVEPGLAFVVERQGRAIQPDGIYTDLLAGDVVKPSPEAFLLFTPYNVACEAVEITGEFMAADCPASGGGFRDLLYDFASEQFIAAPVEQVGPYASRGSSARLHSLPPLSLKLFVESPALAASLKRTPFISLTENKAEADVLVLGQAELQLIRPGDSAVQNFHLPAEEAALRQAIVRCLRFKTMAELSSSAPWPDLEWNINIHVPSENGALHHDGRTWSLSKVVKARGGGGADAPIAFQKETLLTFDLINRSDKAYYAYLLNYTGDGQILPFLPPKNATERPNLVEAGEELPLHGVFLELAAPQEFVRLIISENPLDLYPFSQESFETAAEPAEALRLRPVPKESWVTAVQIFEVE